MQVIFSDEIFFLSGYFYIFQRMPYYILHLSSAIILQKQIHYTVPNMLSNDIKRSFMFKMLSEIKKHVFFMTYLLPGECPR